MSCDSPRSSHAAVRGCRWVAPDIAAGDARRAAFVRPHDLPGDELVHAGRHDPVAVANARRDDHAVLAILADRRPAQIATLPRRGIVAPHRGLALVVIDRRERQQARRCDSPAPSTPTFAVMPHCTAASASSIDTRTANVRVVGIDGGRDLAHACRDTACRAAPTARRRAACRSSARRCGSPAR